MDPSILYLAVVILAAAVVAVVVWSVRVNSQRAQLLADREHLRGNLDRSEQELVESRQQVESYRAEIDDLKGKIAATREQLVLIEQRHQQAQQAFEEAQQRSRETFKALAGDTLRESIEQFLQLARKTFQGEQKDAAAQLEQRRQAIEALVKPINESLTRVTASVHEAEKSRQLTHGSLTQQLQQMLDDQRLLRRETSNLVTALRRPQVRGRWGEMQLRRVAELAGMVENCDFFEQQHVPTEDGGLRPDMVVRLPNGRTIVVDAKTPLDAFLGALECADDQQRESQWRRHVEQIETHVKLLSSKQYAAVLRGSPEFVVLFIPGEGFLYPALQHKPELVESAMEKGVVIATPSTLISLLKAVAMGWREQRVAESARKISEAGKELHSRLETAFGHLGRLGGAIESAVKNFNNLVGSLESNVLPQAKKFEEYGAGSHKQLPEDLKQIETVPRVPRNTHSPAEPGSRGSLVP